jgi:acyl-CoA synthetase (AMP-forming)/AMP-acid ligase II
MNTETQVPGSLARLDHLGDISFLGSYLDHWGRETPSATAVTYHDHTTDRHGVIVTTTYGELDQWSRALAVRITELTEPGDRVAILTPQGTEYVAGFVGAMRTHAINVPLFSPDLPRQESRLQAIVGDCAPTCVLTTTEKYELVKAFCAEHAGLSEDQILCIDEFRGDPDGLSDRFAFPETLELDDIAYLQYTSGSTRLPAGVVLTHRNLTENAMQLRTGHDLDFRRETCVSWLPLFHDMGLLTGICGPIIGGFESVLLDPVAFIIKPRRWLEAMSGRRDVITGGPNFAYDYVVKRVKAADREGLDLSGVRAWMNGAEPVQPTTLDRFFEAFRDQGVTRRSLKPTYGLAEATVFVSVTLPDEEPTVISVDAEQLQQSVARIVGPGDEARAVPLVASGHAIDQHLLIVDADTREQLPEGQIGEIWLHGPNIGQGYWQRPDETREAFEAELAQPAGLPAPWLRTGDLGVLIDGRLFVTGRIKDLMIVDGRNIYPHDVEGTIDEAHPSIAQRRLAAFSIPGATGEAIVVVAERYRGAEVAPDDVAGIVKAAKAAVSDDHAVALHEFVLVEPDSIPWTSSGKIARRATRTAYLAGELKPIAGA